MKKNHLAAFAVASLVSGTNSFAADHLDAPNLAPDQGNGNVDINDLYAFQSPSNPDNTVLIMTVNPGAGGAVSADSSLRESAFYSFNIDNDADNVADISYTASFSGGAGLMNEQQMFTINRTVTGATPTLFASGTTGGTTGGGVAFTGATSGSQAQVGTFDDPFFFDLTGFQNTLAGTGGFTGDDFFEGLNVTAVIIEVPSADLINASSNISVWATTTDGGNQIDRIGRPAINTVLIPSERKDEFNAASPVNDGVFGDDVELIITGTLGNSQENAEALSAILLPDVLTVDTADAAGFLNGRGLSDDVIDAELGLLTDGAITTDGVDVNDNSFSDQFPYLAAANPVPEPSSALLLVGALAAGMSRRARRA